MLYEERLEAAERRRKEGNGLFAEGKYTEALAKYAMVSTLITEGDWGCSCIVTVRSAPNALLRCRAFTSRLCMRCCTAANTSCCSCVATEHQVPDALLRCPALTSLSCDHSAVLCLSIHLRRRCRTAMMTSCCSCVVTARQVPIALLRCPALTPLSCDHSAVLCYHSFHLRRRCHTATRTSCCSCVATAHQVLDALSPAVLSCPVHLPCAGAVVLREDFMLQLRRHRTLST
jgi:hypothetical protein